MEYNEICALLFNITPQLSRCACEMVQNFQSTNSTVDATRNTTRVEIVSSTPYNVTDDDSFVIRSSLLVFPLFFLSR